MKEITIKWVPASAGMREDNFCHPERPYCRPELDSGSLSSVRKNTKCRRSRFKNGKTLFYRRKHYFLQEDNFCPPERHFFNNIARR